MEDSACLREMADGLSNGKHSREGQRRCHYCVTTAVLLAVVFHLLCLMFLIKMANRVEKYKQKLSSS